MTEPTKAVASTWRSLNDRLLAPVVTAPNLGLAAINGSVGGVARASEKILGAMAQTLGTPGKLAEKFCQRVANRTLERAEETFKTIESAWSNAAGRDSGTNSNALLSKTVLDKGTATAFVPLRAAADAVQAAYYDVPAVRDGAYRLWITLSRYIGGHAAHGILDGEIRHDTDSKLRFGFIYMTTQGPIYAVVRDIRGVVGGVTAFSMGDFEWLGSGARSYWNSMEYVYDKWLADETQPESDFPISGSLARGGKRVITRFPRPFVAALEAGEPAEVLKTIGTNRGEIANMFFIYPYTTFRVLYDVMKFTGYAWLQAADSLNYVLCEHAIVTSENLTRDQKLEAEHKLRKTAGNVTIEFEYYVPLVVALDGEPSEQAHRKNFVGDEINHGTIARSVFERRAIERAQAITVNVIQRRAFLWLYGDEERADRASRAETRRKFGKRAADRLKGDDRYALTSSEIADLTKAGKRTDREVILKLSELLRLRGLLEISDLVADREPTAVYECSLDDDESSHEKN